MMPRIKLSNVIFFSNISLLGLGNVQKYNLENNIRCELLIKLVIKT